jgi:hypothetical protein
MAEEDITVVTEPTPIPESVKPTDNIENITVPEEDATSPSMFDSAFYSRTHESTIDAQNVIPEKKVISLKTITLYNIYKKELEDGNTVYIEYYYCTDDENKPFILNKNINTEIFTDIGIDPEDILDDLPMIESEFDFIGRRILYHNIPKVFPSYTTTMTFHVDEGYETSENPIIYIRAINLQTKAKVRIDMSADIFAALAFTDSYITEGINCEHDLTLATAISSKELDTAARFFRVRNIKILDMCSTEKEEPGLIKKITNKVKGEECTSAAIALQVADKSDNIWQEDCNVVSLLIIFDIGEYCNNTEGCTIDTIQNKYYGKQNQFVATLTINDVLLNNDDTSYMIIRGKDSEGTVRIFLFDYKEIYKLKSLINDRNKK